MVRRSPVHRALLSGRAPRPIPENAFPCSHWPARKYMDLTMESRTVESMARDVETDMRISMYSKMTPEDLSS